MTTDPTAHPASSAALDRRFAEIEQGSKSATLVPIWNARIDRRAVVAHHQVERVIGSVPSENFGARAVDKRADRLQLSLPPQHLPPEPIPRSASTGPEVVPVWKLLSEDLPGKTILSSRLPTHELLSMRDVRGPHQHGNAAEVACLHCEPEPLPSVEHPWRTPELDSKRRQGARVSDLVQDRVDIRPDHDRTRRRRAFVGQLEDVPELAVQRDARNRAHGEDEPRPFLLVAALLTLQDGERHRGDHQGHRSHQRLNGIEHEQHLTGPRRPSLLLKRDQSSCVEVDR